MQDNKLFAYPPGKCLTQITGLLPLNKWMHLCAGYGQEIFILDFNNTRTETNLSEFENCKNPIPNRTGLTLALGGRSNETFIGTIANPSIFTKLVTFQSYVNISKCIQSNDKSVIETNVDLSNGVKSQVVSYQYLCNPATDSVLGTFAFKGDKNRAETYCMNFNGRLVNKNDNYLDIIYDVIDSLDGQIETYVFYTQESSPNNACDAISLSIDINQISEEQIKIPCNTLLDIVACYIPSEQPITFKWADQQATLFPRKVANRLSFVNPEKNSLEIKTLNKSNGMNLEIQQSNGQKLTSFVRNDRFILGRYIWTTETGESILQTITACSENEYTCRNGACIPLTNRCDRKPDCNDSSDEGSTCKILMTLSDSYERNVCPDKRPLVSLKVESFGVNDVNLNQNEFTMTLQTQISWTDTRLQFTSLDLTFNGTGVELNEGDETNIWVPLLFFENAMYEDNLNIRNKEKVFMSYYLTAKSSGTNRVINSHEGNVFYSML